MIRTIIFTLNFYSLLLYLSLSSSLCPSLSFHPFHPLLVSLSLSLYFCPFIISLPSSGNTNLPVGVRVTYRQHPDKLALLAYTKICVHQIRPVLNQFAGRLTARSPLSKLVFLIYLSIFLSLSFFLSLSLSLSQTNIHKIPHSMNSLYHS